MKSSLAFLMILLTLNSQSAEALRLLSSLSTPRLSSQGREKVIGNILKNSLENYHYSGIKINDATSKKAFQEYIKKIDYGKQFLYQEDIQKLEKYRLEMDNQMVSGNYQLINLTVNIFEKRIQEAEQFRQKFFKKRLKFKKNESLELDPEKRKFARTQKQWENHWGRFYTHLVLNRYLSMLENKDEEAKADKKDQGKTKKTKKAKKKEKKLTDKEMREKAHVAISEKYQDIFKRLLKEERMDYLEKFFNSVAKVFDPHTSYLPPKKKEDFDIDISGQLEGIGAVLQTEGAYVKVARIVPGGAAWRQNDLEAGDLILMVGEGKGEPVDLMDMRIDDAVRYIRGKKGTEVRLTVKKADGTRKVIPIIRDVVKMEAAFAKSSVLEHKNLGGLKVGYIHLPKFYRDFDDPSKNCSRDVKREVERLKKYKVDGIVLDLRNNGGGALPDAREISGLFVPSGPIVQTRNYAKKVEILEDRDGKVSYEGPLIVMTNRFSASASEILAGALQDYQRAIIVGGEYTHGKGTVQAVLPLNAGIMRQILGEKLGALKVTIQKFYRINGVSTQYKGITPDIIIPDPMDYSKDREKDLDYSLSWAKIEEKKYKAWTQHKYNRKTLKKRSSQRVAKNSRFQKIKESVNYIINKREDTKVSLNLNKVRAEDKKNQKIAESLKLDKKSKKIKVSHFSEASKGYDRLAKVNKERWKKDLELKRKDWVEGILKDPGVEEALFIMGDMIRQVRGQKLTSL